MFDPNQSPHFKALQQLNPLPSGAEEYAVACALDRVLEREDSVYWESLPDMATDALSRWEAMYGLSGAGTIEDRQQDLLAAINRDYGIAKKHYLALAATLGFSIIINAPPKMFRAGVSRVGFAVYEDAEQYTWEVIARPDEINALKPVFAREKPPFTVIRWGVVNLFKPIGKNGAMAPYDELGVDNALTRLEAENKNTNIKEFLHADNALNSIEIKNNNTNIREFLRADNVLSQVFIDNKNTWARDSIGADMVLTGMGIMSDRLFDWQQNGTLRYYFSALRTTDPPTEIFPTTDGNNKRITETSSGSYLTGVQLAITTDVPYVIATGAHFPENYYITASSPRGYSPVNFDNWAIDFIYTDDSVITLAAIIAPNGSSYWWKLSFPGEIKEGFVKSVRLKNTASRGMSPLEILWAGLTYSVN